MSLVSVSLLLLWHIWTSPVFFESPRSQDPYVIVLGNVQDGGYPHIACTKECCILYYNGKQHKLFVSSIAVVDPVSEERFIFDCTPDFPAQLHLLDSLFPSQNMADGILLTHAHIGHYTGLMYLGRESMNASGVKVYALPEMQNFLKNNGPWSQLVTLNNIALQRMEADKEFRLNDRITVTPFLVPHRHEYTETAGFRIAWKGRSVIFIPDIDKWEKWDRDILKLIDSNDLLFLDGTFFGAGEISGRDMNEIPHPFISESMELFKRLSNKQKSKIHFIHLNHSNPALIAGSDAWKEINKKGFQVAIQGNEY